MMGKITTSLSERTMLVKMFKDYCRDKRIEFMPTTLLGWCEMQGYLNVDAIREDLEKCLKDQENSPESSGKNF